MSVTARIYVLQFKNLVETILVKSQHILTKPCESVLGWLFQGIFSYFCDAEGSISSEGESAPQDKPQKTSKGLSDFCVKNIEEADFGRKEINIAQQGEANKFVWNAFIHHLRSTNS